MKTWCILNYGNNSTKHTSTVVYKILWFSVNPSLVKSFWFLLPWWHLLLPLLYGNKQFPYMKMPSAKWRWCGKILSKYLKFISKVVVWFDFVQRMSMNIMFHLYMECYSTAKHLNENWSTTRNNLLHLQKKSYLSESVALFGQFNWQNIFYSGIP